MLKDLSHEFVQGLLLKKDPTALSEARHGIIRRNVEGFATAILYALLLKQFAVDTFQVPTESMEPAIIGRGGMGDRLLVDRLEYLSGDPARYDIVVFKYPLSRLVNYVKRAVGLPGERVVIWRGQIFAAPNHGEDVKCTRKPDGVQEAIFASQPVVAKDETEDFTSMKFFKNWQANGFTPEWRDGRTRVAAPKDQERLVENKFTVTNARTDPYAKEAQGKGGGQETCGDVRFDVEVRAEAGTSAVLLDVTDPSNAGRAIRLDLAVEGGAPRTELSFGDKRLGDDRLGAIKLKPGSSTRVALDNVDQTIVVRFDGDVVFRHEYEVKPQKNVGLGVATRLRAGVRSGAAEFSRLAVFRDLHYSEYPNAPTEFFVPPDSYLMFGDNSPNSLDARGWKSAAIRIKGEATPRYGDAEAVSERLENQRRMRNPFKDERDGRDYFLDALGNLIALKPGEWDLVDAATGETRMAGVKSVDDVPDPDLYRRFDHYVPRAYVLGRAKCVFFPIPRIGVLR